MSAPSSTRRQALWRNAAPTVHTTCISAVYHLLRKGFPGFGLRCDLLRASLVSVFPGRASAPGPGPGSGPGIVRRNRLGLSGRQRELVVGGRYTAAIPSRRRIFHGTSVPVRISWDPNRHRRCSLVCNGAVNRLLSIVLRGSSGKSCGSAGRRSRVSATPPARAGTSDRRSPSAGPSARGQVVRGPPVRLRPPSDLQRALRRLGRRRVAGPEGAGAVHISRRAPLTRGRFTGRLEASPPPPSRPACSGRSRTSRSTRRSPAR